MGVLGENMDKSPIQFDDSPIETSIHFGEFSLVATCVLALILSPKPSFFFHES